MWYNSDKDIDEMSLIFMCFDLIDVYEKILFEDFDFL